MYAIDSLRQLSLKFLSKDEMAGFNFQRMFLKPFEVIMLRNSNTEVREFLLSSLNHLLLAKAPNVRSGWKSIFAVFAKVLDDFSKIFPLTLIAGFCFAGWL